MSSMIDKVMSKIAIPIIVVAGILLIVLTAVSCIVSQNAKSREQSDIKQYYVIVEKYLGIGLTRYESSNQ